jgi:hypothetical protein
LVFVSRIDSLAAVSKSLALRMVSVLLLKFTAKFCCEILLRSFAAKFCQGTLPQDFALKRVVLIGRTECFGKETQTDGSDFR